MNKMPYLFFIAFTFWKLNPPGWMVLAFLVMVLADVALVINRAGGRG